MEKQSQKCPCCGEESLNVIILEDGNLLINDNFTVKLAKKTRKKVLEWKSKGFR